MTRVEIQRVMGQPTAKPAKGLTLAVSRSCNFDVSATDAQPEGTVTTFVQTTGSKIAFDVNSTAEGIERVPEIPKAFYDPRTGALTTLKGSIYLTVQSVFIGAELPIRMVDRKAETITLMKIARKPV